MFFQIDGSVANHPNLWYQISVRYHKVKSGQSISTSNDSTTDSTINPTNSSSTTSTAPNFEEKESRMEIVQDSFESENV